VLQHIGDHKTASQFISLEPQAAIYFSVRRILIGESSKTRLKLDSQPAIIKAVGLFNFGCRPGIEGGVCASCRIVPSDLELKKFEIRRLILTMF
jgi:hypothetical protein